MEQKNLASSLLEQIRSKNEAHDVVRTFYEAYGTLSEGDLSYFRSLLLSTAKECDHIELMTLVISGSRGDETSLNDSCGVISQRSDVVCKEYVAGKLLLEIATLLTSTDDYDTKKAIRTLVSSSSDAFKDDHGNDNNGALLMILNLARECYSGVRRLLLAEVVKLVIDKGAGERFSLSYLVNQVEYMLTDDMETATAGRHMVLQITRSLLSSNCPAGGTANDNPIECLFEMLLEEMGCYTLWPTQRLRKRSNLRPVSINLLLIKDLIVLLFASGVQPTRCTPSDSTQYFLMLEYASYLARRFEIKHVRDHYIESYRIIMDCIGDMFRCFYLFDTHKIVCQFFECDTPYGLFCGCELCENVFAKIALYSSHLGSSTRLIRVILNILSENQVKKLKNRLLERRASISIMEITPITDPHGFVSEELRAINESLKWVARTEPLFSLQNICRHTIIRSMSHRGVHAVTTLSLPKCLEEYVLLQ